MKRAGLVGVAALSVGLACTEAGRSVVLVDLSAPSVTGIGSVLVHVTQGGTSLNHADVNGPLPLQVGIYLPKTVSGSVNIEVCAFMTTSTTMREVIAAMNTPVPVTVTPGHTTGPVTVLLQPGPPSLVCGGGGAGRGGSGGAAGAGAAGAPGTAGMGGSVVAGTGGGVAGVGGVAGTGSGGTTGLAGRGGTGGVATGGTGGGAGRGGTTGAAGTGGTGSGSDWRGQAPVSAGPTFTERSPSVAVAFDGKAVVAFERDGQIYASCYDPSGLFWSNPMPIGGSGTYQLPVVAVDGAGRFTAVWSHGPGATATGVWQNTTSTDCTAWMGLLPLTSANASQATVAVNSGGVAIAAWMERDPINLNTQAVASVRAGPTAPAWAQQTLAPGTDMSDKRPVVGVSTVGEGFVVWQQLSTAAAVDSVLYAQRQTTGSWTPARELNSAISERTYAPAIATNGNNAIVTYLQRKGNVTELWSTRYSGSVLSGFAAALKVADAPEIDAVSPPSVTLDDDLTATAAWAAAPVGGNFNVYTNRVGATGSWPMPPTMIESNNQAALDQGVSQAPMPTVRGDGTGTVMLIWRKRPTGTTRFDLFSSRYTPTTMWGAETMVEGVDVINGNIAGVFSPVLGINGSGRAVAAWYYGGASPDVYANVSR